MKAVSDAEEGAVRTEAGSRRKTVEVQPRPGNGVWKVKLVINPKDLEKILSEEVNTEALIQQMRIAANSTPSRRNSSSCSNRRFIC